MLSLLLLALLAYQQLAAAWSPGRDVWLAFLPLSGPTVLAVDVSWYPPKQTEINNLTAVLSGSGVYGFIFNSSTTPDEQYGTYNWCDMPHVRRREYVRPAAEALRAGSKPSSSP